MSSRKQWDKATPASQAVDADKLDEALAYLKAHCGRDGVRQLVLVRNGYVIWQGGDSDKMHGVWSVTKTFTGIVLGLLIDEGKATLETKAKQYAPDLVADYPTLTLRDFTTQTSGYQAQADQPRDSYTHGPSRTPFRPGTPLFTPPGSKFAYWDSAMNEFGLVLTKIANRSLKEVFQQGIADPIGMDPDQWDWGVYRKVDGLVVNGGSGNDGADINVSARELARLGLLFLNQGRWNGKQLLSATWIDVATQTQVPASTPLAEPRRSPFQGPGCYGYNWWTNGVGANEQRKWPGAPNDTYAAKGANNNVMFVIPAWNMVVVRLGLDGGDGKITDEVYGRFLSKVGQAILPKTPSGSSGPIHRQ